MIRDPNPRVLRLALALLIVVASAESGLARTAPVQNGPATEVQDHAEMVENLAGEVAEIASSSMISRAKKEKRISTAVRIAVVAATAYKKRPEDILGTALELTDAAARVAPSYAEVIANAVSFAPSLARIDSAHGQIRTAAFAAAKTPKASRRTTVARTRQPETVQQSEYPPPAAVGHRNVRSAPSDEPEPGYRRSDQVADNIVSVESSNAPRVALERNSKFNVTAELSVRRDDNVYLTNSDKVSDTIVALAPGLEVSFGQNSLAHGSVSYKNAFTRYLDKSSPNVSLGNGSADFGYDNGSLTVTGSASYQQLNQNNSTVAALGQKSIFRRDVLGINTGIESQVTAKTSVRTGANYNKSTYKASGLTGSQETEVPLKAYFALTPKVSLSTGASYRWVEPQNGGESGRDLAYSAGARGNFTAKLSGEFSVDYRTRKVGSSANEKLLGFNGSFNYELTPKTSSSLAVLRDFSTGALGESLKNSTYALRVSTDLTRQWQLGAGLNYRQVGYGPALFSVNNTPVTFSRNDHYWDANLQATYLYRSWLSATADYNFRHNDSNLPGAQFSNSILSLMLGWRY